MRSGPITTHNSNRRILFKLSNFIIKKSDILRSSHGVLTAVRNAYQLIRNSDSLIDRKFVRSLRSGSDSGPSNRLISTKLRSIPLIYLGSEDTLEKNESWKNNEHFRAEILQRLVNERGKRKGKEQRLFWFILTALKKVLLKPTIITFSFLKK